MDDTNNRPMFTTTQKVWLGVALLFFVANLVVITLLAMRTKNEKDKEKSEDSKQTSQMIVDRTVV